MHLLVRTKSLLIFLLFTLNTVILYAGNGSANANGNWGNPSSWLINGTARVPTCGDTVSIPAGRTITVNSQQIYGCATPLIIIIDGTLQFTTGNKLSLPCGSLVQVNAGGKVIPGGGGGNSNYIEICNNVYWTAASGTLTGPAALGGAPLPIELIAFKAKVEKSTVVLLWSTATEVNNDYFNVERSANGYEWSSINRVDGAGNSTFTIDYTSTDESPIVGISYYRIRQTDFDGTTTVSDPVVVSFNGTRKNNIYVHVSESSMNLFYSVQNDEEAILSISNSIGEIVYTKALQLEKNSTELQLEKPDLSRGVYFITVQSQHQKQSIRCLF